MCVLNGVMNVRVGGGFMNFEDFQAKYGKQEGDKLRRFTEKQQEGDVAV
jgi:hypothetical protein